MPSRNTATASSRNAALSWMLSSTTSCSSPPALYLRHAHSARHQSAPPSFATRPVVSSSSTTPNAYTSTFSFTFALHPYSATARQTYRRTLDSHELARSMASKIKSNESIL
ncbi:hypothetical protein EE612_009911 [Oryza sativa]|nr:hypothetical protein EE612_009911 [Oryza sativa]